LVPTDFELSCPAPLRSQAAQGCGTWKHPELGHTLTALRAQSSLGHCSLCSCSSQNRERSWPNKSGKTKRAPEGRVQFPSSCPGTVAQKGCGAAAQGGWSEGETEWHKLTTIQHCNTWGEFTGGAHEAKTVNG